jgi:dephospho-CoA kinase
MELFILIGAPGIGKTWLCDRLSNDFTIISSDRYRDKIDEAIHSALQQDKPVLVDIPFRIKAFIERWRSAKPSCVVVSLVEDEATHRSRLAMRGGEYTDSILKRVRRVNSIARKYGNISGTSDFLIESLRQESRILRSPETRDEPKPSNVGRRPSALHLKILAERNASGWQSAPEVRRKISEANKGLKLTDDQLQRLSEATSGERNGMHGKKHSEDSKQKMSESKKKLMSDEGFKEKFRRSRSKFAIVSPSGEEFFNDRDAAAKTGMSRSKIRKLLEDSSSGWKRVETSGQ